MTRRPERRGLTLIEVAAAIAISGLALLGATLVLDQLHDGHVRLARRAQEAAREANGERLLRRLVRDAEVGSDSTQWFQGAAGSARFRGWCEVPAGWLERCAVSLGLDWRDDSTAVSAMLSTGEVLPLAIHAGRAEFRYLDRTARDTAWVVRWTPSVVLPVAIAIAGERDTVLLPVGGGHD
ncbi:MAG TPA: prepilin-type N-terminal cleavage/methylation domain-containing protein [Gemmatimonadaceae bacterium]|nr:prepilin-type N-terminal cleavage/methylation domain-containing protein [Gemmatimonadaceae bacterium]